MTCSEGLLNEIGEDLGIVASMIYVVCGPMVVNVGLTLDQQQLIDSRCCGALSFPGECCTPLKYVGQSVVLTGHRICNSVKVLAFAIVGVESHRLPLAAHSRKELLQVLPSVIRDRILDNIPKLKRPEECLLWCRWEPLFNIV